MKNKFLRKKKILDLVNIQQNQTTDYYADILLVHPNTLRKAFSRLKKQGYIINANKPPQKSAWQLTVKGKKHLDYLNNKIDDSYKYRC